MLKIGVVGGTGYTGVELLRLIAQHPQAELACITSRSEKGLAVSDLFPNLRGHIDIAFSDPTSAPLKECDVVFFATPNGIAMQHAVELLDAGVKLIDLAADFRLKDEALWTQWYHDASKTGKHACPELLAQAVYGLPEVNREEIKTAQLVANPGCYPTAVQLALLPLVEAGIVDASRLIVDAKSGVSGAGRGASVGTLQAESSESMKAYAVAGHRHLPEIKQGLQLAQGGDVGLTFVPHLTPMIRGIHATCYAELTSKSDLQVLFEKRYKNEPFVDVMPLGSHPETRSVRGVNTCRIAVHQPQQGNTVVVLSVIDNLVKGAAGQAIHNMNLMCGLDETMGLNTVALMP